MLAFDPQDLKKLYVPSPDSHKGQNGKLLVIGGSELFHAASLWSLQIATKIVDMVFYSSVPSNHEIMQKNKELFLGGIVVPREKIDAYIQEVDAVLLGPGLPRESGRAEGEESTRELTKRLLASYPDKKWVLDAGSLTEMDPQWLKDLHGNVIITPHKQEFEKLFGIEATAEMVEAMAREYNTIILLKGQTDIICSKAECAEIPGGNAGMTKGGTGDVLSGLVAALACKNDLFLAASSGSYINKLAGDSLEKKVGLWFSASDLVQEIPFVTKQLT